MTDETKCPRCDATRWPHNLVCPICALGPEDFEPIVPQILKRLEQERERERGTSREERPRF